MTKVFIDGSSGTTGLRIYERIEARTDIELIKLPEEKRKDEAARKEALHEADIVSHNVSSPAWGRMTAGHAEVSEFCSK